MTTDSAVSQRTPAQHAVAEHLRLLASGQVQEWLALFATDAVLTFPYAPAGMPDTVRGHEALLDHMTHFPETFDVQFVDLTFQETADPHVAVAEFRSVGRAVPTGKPYEQTCISVVHTDRDGLITRYVDYWNPLVALEALTPDDAVTASSVAGAFGS